MFKKICILVATRNRKTSLIKFLNSVVNLQIPNNINVQVLLSINDNQNYSEIINLFKNKFRIRIVTERKKGISNARNKYLKSINKNEFDYFAFFDDDVEVDKKWLVEMLNFLNKNKADIVGGPQLTKSNSMFSKLLVRNERHGSKVKWVSTNNCIVKKKVLQTNITFDQKMNLIGGEDQLFFLKLYKMGLKLKWNRKAKVIEEEKKKSKNLFWFLRRNFRYGASSNLIYKKTYGFFGGIFFTLIKFLLDLIRLVYYLLISINLSKKNFYRFLMYTVRLLGLIFGLFGFQYKEYA